MKAYTHGITKEQFVNETKAHALADNFIKGEYDAGQKGCAVGCALKSVNKLKNINLDVSSHKEYETHLGVPEWLARLEDKIFEGLPNERSKTWPVEFAEAINEGSELDKIKMPFLIFIVELARKSTKNKTSLEAIDGVLFELKQPVLNLNNLIKARRAAAYAANAAYAAYAANATYAAIYAANAAANAYAAADAAAAANAADAAAYDANAASAAYATAYDDNAAARKNTYIKFADKLLELIRGCK